MARPKGSGKPIEEKYVTRAMKWPPALWQELQSAVPEKERSDFIRGAVERALGDRKSEVVPLPPDPDWRRETEALVEQFREGTAASQLSDEELEAEIQAACNEGRTEAFQARREVLGRVKAAHPAA